MAQRHQALPRRSRVTAALASALLGLVALLATVVLTVPARAAADTDHLVTGERLGARESLVSLGGTTVLVVQRSGRVSLYGPGGDVVWTVDGGTRGAELELDEAGRLRLVAPSGRTLWTPDEQEGVQVVGARLEVRDDGDLVLLDAAGATVWATGTSQRASTLVAGGSVVPGQPLTSPDGRHVLVVRRTGNVVLLGPDSLPRWAAGTEGEGAALTLDDAGVLVVKDDDGAVVWRTHRPAVPGSTLVLQDDGDLVLLAPDGSAVWSSGTGLGAASLEVDGVLPTGGHLDGPDGHVRLTLTEDELALRYDDTVVWQAPETPGPDASLRVRSDGRLVLLAADGRALWGTPAPDSQASPGSALRLDPAGALLTAGNGQELWRVDVPADVVVSSEVPVDCSLVDAPVPLESTVLTSHGVRVHACLADAVDALITQARAAGVELGASGWRSREQQQAARARNCRPAGGGAVVCRPPTAVPGHSRHEWGLALDLTEHGRLIRTGTPAWDWLVEHAGDYGLQNLPGEPWHWSVDGS
ncbi:D-alanyl-D-alanine carboxypeptidase family protein [Cellulomonas persica]|uniref:D-alanyl-D-alanine carboxypeptidase family protein n=1 Tax=Cellulomonas persica TaxID=76861 RepID=UPI0011BDFA06|nr:D-alanyl-D-alanine carboxypeptidase family protein [Cellulomonas persica]